MKFGSGIPALPISVNIFVSSVPSITRAYPSTTLAHPNSSASTQFWVTLSQSGSPFVMIFSVANRCRIFLNKQSWWFGNKHQKGNTLNCVKDGSCNGFRGVYFTKNEGRFWSRLLKRYVFCDHLSFKVLDAVWFHHIETFFFIIFLTSKGQIRTRIILNILIHGSDVVWLLT